MVFEKRQLSRSFLATGDDATTTATIASARAMIRQTERELDALAHVKAETFETIRRSEERLKELSSGR